MDATFRVWRLYRSLGLVFLPLFLPWALLAFWMALTDPDVRGNRAALAAFNGGVPLFMAGLSLWTLADYWRRELTIRGDRIILRGVIRRREIDLRDVTEARWRLKPVGGSLVLRSGSVRIAIHFEDYEPEERAPLVRSLRSAVPREVQAGWDLFEYGYGYLRPRPVPFKPGPDEILLRRGRWTRIFVPALLVGGLIGVVDWWCTGEWLFAAGPIVGVGLYWVLMRATTPAEGMVVERLEALHTPETNRFMRFLLIWHAVFFAGGLVLDKFRSRLSYPNAAMIFWGLVWLGVIMVEARYRVRREQEAAGLAAKARREARPIDLS